MKGRMGHRGRPRATQNRAVAVGIIGILGWILSRGHANAGDEVRRKWAHVLAVAVTGAAGLVWSWQGGTGGLGGHGGRGGGRSPATRESPAERANADGGAEGADRTFRTASGPALPGISSTAAREVGPTSASLRSRIDPNRGTTTYHFEYGLSQSYGTSTPERERRRRRRSRGRRRGDRRPAAVPPLPLPRRGDQRGRPAGQRQPHLHHEAPADRRHALARRAAHDTGARGSRSSAASSRPGVNGIQVALERQDFPFAGPFSSFGAPAPMQGGPHGQLPLLRALAVLRHTPARAHAHGRAGRQPAGDRATSPCGSGRDPPRDAPRGADPRLGACRPCRTGARCCSGRPAAAAGCSCAAPTRAPPARTARATASRSASGALRAPTACG